MGEEVRFHMWGNAREDVTLVNGAAGSTMIPLGGVAIAYGPDMSEGEVIPHPRDTLVELGGVSFEITDSAGQSHLATLLYVSPTQINILTPAGAAPGPAVVKILHPVEAGAAASTGSSETTSAAGATGPVGKAFLAPIAPGLFTATANARGPVVGYAVRTAPDGGQGVYAAWQCDEFDCRTEPIVVSSEFSTELILFGTGFGDAIADGGMTPEQPAPSQQIQATIGGIAVPVLSVTPLRGFPGVTELRLQLAPQLEGIGEADLLLTVAGQVANSVRVHVE
jgi:uncharacterized protein (TIGR03437 family)